MSLVTLISFLFFTGLVGLITWWLTRKDDHQTSDGYFLGGRALTGGYIAGSLLLTNLSTEQLVGLNGAAFADGLCVMAWEVIAALSLVVMGLVFLPRYLKQGVATVPEFLERRFDGGTRTITTVIFIVAYAGILLPMVLYTGALAMSEMLDMGAWTGITNAKAQLWVAVWFLGIVGSIYAIFGGLRTVAVSDTLNGFGLFVGGLAVTYFGLRAINSESIVGAMQTMYQEYPEKFNSLGSGEQSVPFSTLFTGVLLLNLFYWTTNQQIIQRTLGAQGLAEGQRGVLIAAFFKVLAPVILVLPGLIAFFLYGRIVVDGKPVPIADVVTDSMALVGTYEAEGRNESLILHGTDAEHALGVSNPSDAQDRIGTSIEHHGRSIQVEHVLGKGTVLTGSPNEGYQVHQDHRLTHPISPRIKDKAYGTLVREKMPRPLTGFFAAVIAGAILSSFNSALNATATLFSLGVYQHLIRPEATEQQVIRAGKLCGLVVALTSMTIAPLLAGQESIFAYLQKMNGLYFIPIFSVVVIGMLTRHVPARAAKWALVVGFGVISAAYFIPVIEEQVSVIHGFHFLGLVFASLVAMMLVMGAIWPQPASDSTADPVHVVDRTPWKYAMPAGVALTVFVLALYVTFADFSAIQGSLSLSGRG